MPLALFLARPTGAALAKAAFAIPAFTPVHAMQPPEGKDSRRGAEFSVVESGGSRARIIFPLYFHKSGSKKPEIRGFVTGLVRGSRDLPETICDGVCGDRRQVRAGIARRGRETAPAHFNPTGRTPPCPAPSPTARSLRA